MSKYSQDRKKIKKNYKKRSSGQSVLDNNPTLITYRYRVPNTYRNAVNDVLVAFRAGVPFNKAVDQVAALNPHTINRNKLAEHTLRFIANDC